MHIYSVTDPEFKPYGRVWDDVPSGLTAPFVETLSATPIPEGSKYVASAPELEQVEEDAPGRRQPTARITHKAVDHHHIE